MTAPAGGRRAEALAAFDNWLELPTPKQQAELDRLRAADPVLHEQLLALIRADQEATTEHFLDGSAIADAVCCGPETEADAGVPDAVARIGPWTLEKSLGAGGMGRVWLARRHDGLFEGFVAIKMLRDAVADDFAVERFAREGEILARLAHPNIARLLDAGTLPDGQRYLVIEYVHGERIDIYCDHRRLDVAARIRLFLQVCGAVAHAHANLVVHRDLKPANILVMDDGQVKLLDFGVAKLIEAESASSEESPLTRVAGAGLTPEYAAPEQIEGGAITTATDVYSLGVVLYRLLSGSRPYGSEAASPAKLAREIVDTEAQTLSASVDTSAVTDATRVRAEKRSTSPERLHRQLAGDLDNILAKTLKKQAGERYVSVRALMDDLEAHLDNRPVTARGDSFGYLAGKFVRRHWLGVAAGTALVLSVVAGIAGFAWEARIAVAQEIEARRQATIAREKEAVAESESARARASAIHAAAEEAAAKEQQASAERYRADAQIEARRAIEQEAIAKDQSQAAKAEAAKAKAVRDFMVDIFRANLPSSIDIEKAQQLTARELLETGAQRIGSKFADQPEVQADLLDIVGELFYRLGDHEKAKQMTRDRIAALEKAPGNQERSKLTSYRDLAYVSMAEGDTEAVRREAKLVEPLLASGALTEQAQSDWRNAWTELHGDPKKAIVLANRAVEGLARIDYLSGTGSLVGNAYEIVARAQVYLGRYDLASLAADSAYRAVRRIVPVDRYVAVLKSALIAEVQAGAEMKMRAAVALRAAHAGLVRTLGRRHSDTLAVQAKLGALLHDGPDRAEGLALLEGAVKQSALAVHRNAIDDVQMRVALGRAYYDEGRFGESEAALSAALSATRGKPDLRMLHALGQIAMSRVMTATGKHDEAIAAALAAKRIFVEGLGERSPMVAEASLALIEAMAANDRIGDARTELAMMESIPEATGRRYAVVQRSRRLVEAGMYLEWGERGEAGQRFATLLQQAEDDEDAAYHSVFGARAALGLGRARLADNLPPQARLALERTVELRRRLGPPDSPWLAQAKVVLADCLITQGERKEAARLLDEADAAFAKHMPLGQQFLHPLEKVKQRL